MNIHTINTYGKSSEEVRDSVSKYLSPEYILGWTVLLPDSIDEHPYAYYTWKKTTNESFNDFKMFLNSQRALMNEAILKAQGDLKNGV